MFTATLELLGDCIEAMWHMLERGLLGQMVCRPLIMWT